MDKIEKEKDIVGRMILIYCRKHHTSSDSLCSACESLKSYALSRLSNCRFGDQKTACKACKVHCYKADMRERIREVMRYSGPRLILYSPITFFKHLIKK